MNTPRLIIRLLPLAGLWAMATTLVLSAACVAHGTPAAPSTSPPASVQDLIGDAGCDSDAQCRTVGVGAKACGGPERYLAWSTLKTDGAALQQQAAREAERRAKEGAARGEMSTCSVVPDPGAYCALPSTPSPSTASDAGRGVCRLRPSRALGPV